MTHKSPLLDEKGDEHALSGIATDITDRKKRQVAFRERAATKMLALMEDLLCLAEMGRLERPEELVEGAEVAGQVLKEFEMQIRWVEAEVRPGNPPGAKVPWKLLGQFFENLIGNALRYGGGEGGGEIGGGKGALLRERPRTG